MNVIAIGVCGGKRHGKDAAANALVDLGFIKVSMADALKRAAAEAFGVDVAEFYNDTTKEQSIPGLEQYGTRRHILQKVGTELFRNNFPGIWINTLRRNIVRNGWRRVVIADMRFQDELDFVRSFGDNLSLRVHRSQQAEIDKLAPDGHASEQFYKTAPVDATLINDGGMADLQSTVRRLVGDHFPALRAEIGMLDNNRVGYIVPEGTQLPTDGNA